MADRPNNRGRKSRKKVCGFCVDKVEHIDYKDIARLRRYMSERGKILPRRVTHNFHQACASPRSASLYSRLSDY